jgi:sugar phosphate permease
MNVATATAGMLVILTVASMSVFTTAVAAPQAAADLGLDAKFIGPFTSLVYLVAALAGTVTGGPIRRLGPIRVCQLTMLASAVGMLAFAAAHPLALGVAAVALGLAYGPFNPASAEVLTGIATPRWLPFVFSVKQLGVPLGGMLAGAAVPALSLWLGWQQASMVVAVLAVITALAVQPLRTRFDGDRGGVRRVAAGGLRSSLRLVLADAVLRRYTAVAFAFAGCQLSAGAFLVVYLTGAPALSVVDAGLALAFMQAGGVIGRLAWGALASRLFSTRGCLATLGVCSAALLLGLTRVQGDWPFPGIAVLCLALGLCTFGWNGLVLSQVANLAPEGRAGEATAGMQCVMFGGIVVFPSGVTAAVSLSGGYELPFSVLAGLALLGAALAGTARGKG